MQNSVQRALRKCYSYTRSQWFLLSGRNLGNFYFISYTSSIKSEHVSFYPTYQLNESCANIKNDVEKNGISWKDAYNLLNREI